VPLSYQARALETKFVFSWEYKIIGRLSWGAPEPTWSNEVIYYNLSRTSLINTLTNIVVHHTNNSNSVSDNEKKQKTKGYAALGYHFFINADGSVYEGRPSR